MSDVQFPSYNRAVSLCGALGSKDRFERRHALTELVGVLRHDAVMSLVDFHAFFITHAPALLNTLRDPCEIVREAGIACVRAFVVELLRADGGVLMCVMPVIVERIGTPEMVEKSEECRHQLLAIVQHVLSAYERAHLEPSVGEFVAVLRQSVRDKCPALKCVSCECIMQLARAVPAAFRAQAASMMQCVLKTLKHGHEKVRRSGVTCLGEVLMHCDCDAIAEGAAWLTEKVLDYHPGVRQCVIRVTGNLLMKYRDRYSCFHRLLPIIMTGLNDEVKVIQDEAANLWEKVGIQYVKENEEKLKDQMDYLHDTLPNYPAGVKRPHLGCRALVQNNISKYVTVLAKELKSWQSEVRIRCSELLLSTVIHAEDEIIQHLPSLIPGIYAAIMDDDVAANMIRAVEIMGYFIPVKSWLDLILPSVDTNVNRGHLRMLGGFIRGTTRENIDSDTMLRILNILAEKNHHARKVKFQTDFAECLTALQAHYKCDMPMEVAQALFNEHMIFMSIKDEDTKACLGDLQETLKAQSLDEVWEQHLPTFLEDIVDKNPRAWEQHCIEHSILRCVLQKPRAAVGTNLPKIIKILREVLHEDGDAQARLTIFHSLAACFTSENICFVSLDPAQDYLTEIIEGIIAPALVWKAGKENDSVRAMALTCLGNATDREEEMLMLSKDVMKSIVDLLLPLLLSLSEDQRMRTRRRAMQIICTMKKHLLRTGLWSISYLLEIYPKIMKRLDDGNNEIHCLAAETLLVVLKSPPDDFSLQLYQAHHELIIDTLFVHFDDYNETCRGTIKDAILVMMKVNEKLTLTKSNYYLPFVKNKEECVNIINTLENLKIN